jgi:formamidopyrimidine-DNA glycosylase
VPELPEVETIRRQLEPLVAGRRLQHVEILDPRWSRPLAPEELADALTGRLVQGLGRRGKYLLWELEDDVYLAQHLRMTGSVLADPDPEPTHTRVRIELGPRAGERERADASGSRARPAGRAGDAGRGDGAEGVRLAIVDPRRFGTAELLLGREALEQFLATRLGLEPFDVQFTAQHLHEAMRGRRSPIKAFLLDQRRVAGVGNIYADEALFRAGIHPLRAAGTLTLAQAARLREGVIEALSAGIEARGASIDDFRHVDGVKGSFQDRFLVHLRAGEPCVTCGREIVKLFVAGRGTYVCEHCQPRPRRSAARRPSGPAARPAGPPRRRSAPR